MSKFHLRYYTLHTKNFRFLAYEIRSFYPRNTVFPVGNFPLVNGWSMAIFKIMWNVQICPDIIDFPGPKIYKFLSWITIFLSWKCIKPGEAGSLDQSFTKRYFRLPFHTFDRLKTEKSKFKYNLCYYNQKLHNLQILHNLQMLQKQMMMVLFMMVRQYFLLRTLTLKCGERL